MFSGSNVAMQISQEAEWREISDKDFRTRRVGLFVIERVYFLDGPSEKANWMSYVSRDARTRKAMRWP